MIRFEIKSKQRKLKPGLSLKRTMTGPAIATEPAEQRCDMTLEIGNLIGRGLCADRDSVATQAKALLDEVAGRPGHIFNLGHGIVPETPVDNVKFLVDFVHEQSAR